MPIAAGMKPDSNSVSCLGRPLIELAAPGFVRPLADALQAILRGAQVDNLEPQIMRGNGHLGQFSVNLSPMRDEQGNINSIVVVMTDIYGLRGAARQAGSRRKKWPPLVSLSPASPTK